MNDDSKIFNLYLETTAGDEPEMQVDTSGNKEWWLHGYLHRDNAPAIEYANGERSWYQHGFLHREGGPAVTRKTSKSWYIHGKLHREDGPAVEFKNGDKFWYLRGKRYSTPEQWARSVLTMHNEPHDVADIDAFLKQVLKKDVEEAL